VDAQSAAFASWAFLPGPAFGVLITAIIYFRGWLKLNRQVPARFPLWRLLAFLSGLGALYVSLASPLDAFSSFLLSAHMVQHMTLTMVAPPLLLMGAPQLPLLRGLPKAFVSQGLGPFFHWPVVKGIGHFLLHPAVGWVLFVTSNIFWHIPPCYELALNSRNWHEFEHLCFLGSSLLFWWHIVQPWPSRPRWPRWAMIPYLLLADLQNTALSGFLSFCERVIYPTYANAPRLFDLTPIQDQATAGALMWVPGAIVFLVPVFVITMQFLAPKRRRYAEMSPPPRPPAGAARAEGPFDLLRVPYLGAFLRGPYFRRGAQIVMFGLALVIVLDGLLGPQVSPLNLAGVLPWTHWRAFTVIALLVVGNLFCMACPFTFVRDLGRKVLPARFQWPRALRSKWLAVALLVIYLWAYEAFDLWNKPVATAWLIIGYFLAALLVDGFFKGASFCKYVCPIGQFHFVQSLASPFEIKIRKPDVCASCRTFDCLKGNETQRGCELKLFQPRKQGNMDCTFCLDCVKACPHDNVGLISVAPARDLIHDIPRSSVGKYAQRPDLAVLALVLTFGAFANAAGMVIPVLAGIGNLESAAGLSSDLPIVTALSLLTLVALPLGLASMAGAASSKGAGFREHFCRFSMALAPLGFGMWLAHFAFHLFTGALTPIPVFERALRDMGLTSVDPNWNLGSIAFYNLPALELILLDLGFLVSLYVIWRIATRLPQKPLASFLPWGMLATALYVTGVWVIFQPMQMRGTLMH